MTSFIELKNTKISKVDARTHLIVLLIGTIFWFFYKGTLAIHYMLLLSMMYMSYLGRMKSAIKFVISYLILTILAQFSIHHMALFYIILSTFARVIPLMMIASQIVTSNPSELMASFQKLGVPKAVLVMICILIRFFPVIKDEMLYIRNGIRVRGIFTHWYNVLLHPAMAYECFFMPLIVRCLKLSSELGASAELRGLDSDCYRSTIYEIGFTMKDWIIMSVYLVLSVLIYLGVG